MKRKLYLVIVLAIMVNSVAWSQVSFGVRAGVNLQNLNGKDFDGEKLENDLIFGFHAGVDVEIPVAPDFSFQPGVLFSTKGASVDEDKINLGYIEVPLHFLYKPMLGSGRLIIGLGPYVSYGVTGKIKQDEGSDIDIKFKNNLTDEDLLNEFEGEFFHLKGFDAGADIVAGYQLESNLYIQLNAQLGLLDIYPDYPDDEDDETVIKNTGFGLSVGYRF